MRQLSGEAYAGTAKEVVKIRLNTASTVYRAAYKNHAKVIAEGKAAAKTEEELTVLLAVGTGAAVEGVAIVLSNEAGEESALPSKLAYAAGKEELIATGAEGAKTGAKHFGLLDVVETDLEPGGLKPEVLKLKLWTQLTKLHAEALRVVKLTEMQSLIASGAELCA